MVTRNVTQRDYAAYALERIVALATAGQVRYASSAVFRDSENLGYAPDDVHACVAALETCHFSHSEAYENASDWHDVFKLARYPSPAGHHDDLYIKLKLNRDCVVILLCSFHRDR